MFKPISISVPHRTSISVLDMNHFSLGKPGGGNLGFAIDKRTSLKIYPSKKLRIKTNNLSECRSKELISFTKHYCNLYNYSQKFELDIESIEHHHFGLATSSSFQTALLCILKLYHNEVIDFSTINNCVSENYLEYVDGKLVPGFTTGLSTYINLNGGFAFIDQKLNVLESLKMPEWDYYILSPSKYSPFAFGEIEAAVLMGKGRNADHESVTRKMEIISNRLIPSIINKNLSDFGDSVKELQSIGSKVEEINIYNDLVSNTMEKLHELGIKCTFLSAVGPGIIVVTEKDEKEINNVTSNLTYDILYKGTLDNTGLIIHEEG